MFERSKRERKIRRALRGLSRQYVSRVWWPDASSVPPDRSPPEGPCLDIDDAVMVHDEGALEALQTCILRGWIEELPEKISSRLTPGDNRPTISPWVFPYQITHYRITEAGWSEINRTRLWLIAGVMAGAAGVIIMALTLWAMFLLDN
jgi:hypothetical protein